MSVRLYIAEDTEHVRTMLVDILGLHGFEIVGQAASGEEALRGIEEVDPDVVVMDLKMSGLDGLETARRIREEHPDQQVILYSAYIDADVERRAKEVGVAVCVPKLSGVEALAREITAVAMDLGR
ncbi:MAG: response regulator transcription factor [Actinomycetota bacterium]